MGSGREIPNLFIFAINVVRFSPSLAAAPPEPPMTQPAARNACRIASRVESVSVPCFGDSVTGLFSTAAAQNLKRLVRFLSQPTAPTVEATT